MALEDDTHAGSAGGVVINDDKIAQIALTSNVHGIHYDFCEVLPVSISGHVGLDTIGGQPANSSMPPISGVTIQLLDSDGNVIGTTTTEADGNYAFSGLVPGTYGVREVQPAGYLDGDTEAGSLGGSVTDDQIAAIVLLSGMHATDYDFSEMLPNSISGHVGSNINGDCETNPNTPPIAGVVIHLLDASGNVIGTTTTDANGNYLFDNLAPGNYGVHEDQPSGYFQGDSDVGSAGGNVSATDTTTQIVLTNGVYAVHYNFCETPPATLAGYVFQDGPPILVKQAGDVPDVLKLRDGKLTPDDTRLPGVTLELRDGVTGQPILGSAALPGKYAANQPITTITDRNGHYEFGGLAPGVYAVFDVKPSGYLNGIDTPGSTGGVVISTLIVTDPAVLQQLISKPHDDAIVGIGLMVGNHSINNNFSVVVTGVQPIILPPSPAGAPLLLVAPLVVPFVPLAPPLPPTLPYLLTPQIIRTGGALYTWHLSVVDAGQPRQQSPDSVVQLTTVQPGDEVLWQDNLDEGEWLLAPELRSTGRLAGRKLRFGIRGGIPITGDFDGDGKFEVGVFKDGQWFIDLNDNGIWDAGDLWAKLGHRGDRPVTGDWDGDGKTDIGIYGPAWSGDPRAVEHEPGLPDPHNENTNVHKNIPAASQSQPPLAIGQMKLTDHGKPRART